MDSSQAADRVARPNNHMASKTGASHEEDRSVVPERSSLSQEKIPVAGLLWPTPNTEIKLKRAKISTPLAKKLLPPAPANVIELEGNNGSARPFARDQPLISTTPATFQPYRGVSLKPGQRSNLTYYGVVGETPEEMKARPDYAGESSDLAKLVEYARNGQSWGGFGQGLSAIPHNHPQTQSSTATKVTEGDLANLSYSPESSDAETCVNIGMPSSQTDDRSPVVDKHPPRHQTHQTRTFAELAADQGVQPWDNLIFDDRWLLGEDEVLESTGTESHDRVNTPEIVTTPETTSHYLPATVYRPPTTPHGLAEVKKSRDASEHGVIDTATAIQQRQGSFIPDASIWGTSISSFKKLPRERLRIKDVSGGKMSDSTQIFVKTPQEALRVGNLVREMVQGNATLPHHIPRTSDAVRRYFFARVFGTETWPPPLTVDEAQNMTEYCGRSMNVGELRKEVIKDIDDLVMFMVGTSGKDIRSKMSPRTHNTEGWVPGYYKHLNTNPVADGLFTDQIFTIEQSNKLRSQEISTFWPRHRPFDVPVDELRNVKQMTAEEDQINLLFTTSQTRVDNMESHNATVAEQRSGSASATARREPVIVHSDEPSVMSSSKDASFPGYPSVTGGSQPYSTLAYQNTIPRMASGSPFVGANMGQAGPSLYDPDTYPQQHFSNYQMGINGSGYFDSIPPMQHHWSYQQPIGGYQQPHSYVHQPSSGFQQGHTAIVPMQWAGYHPNVYQQAPPHSPFSHSSMPNQYGQYVQAQTSNPGAFGPPPAASGYRNFRRPAEGRIARLFARSNTPQRTSVAHLDNDASDLQVQAPPAGPAARNTEWMNRNFGKVKPDVPTLPYRAGSDDMHPRTSGEASSTYRTLSNEPQNPDTINAEENVPFEESAKVSQGPEWGVLKIENIPYDLIKPLILTLLGPHAKIITPDLGPAVHIIMERSTGKTMDCFVEFFSTPDARACCNSLNLRHHAQNRIGDRIVDINVSSQDELMKELFPKAKNVAWDRGKPRVLQSNDAYNSGFKSFICAEELGFLVKHAEQPHRSNYILRSPQRTYESMISLLAKFPWYSVDNYTISTRNQIFEATRQMLRVLVNNVRKADNAFIAEHLIGPNNSAANGGSCGSSPMFTEGLLLDFLTAALNARGFSEKQRWELYTMSDFARCHFRVSPLAKYWPWEVLSRKMKVAEDVVEYYANLIAANPDSRPTGHPFGDLSHFTENVDLTEYSMAKVGQMEWIMFQTFMQDL